MLGVRNPLLLLNVGLGETRAALLEDGLLAELHVERASDRSIVGNVYRARVQRVLPGMQAAFVDLGLERAGFLYVDDVRPPESADFAEAFEAGDGDTDETDLLRNGKRRAREEAPNIASLVREGQTLTVQVRKAPLGTKGARVTTHVTLPGRALVYLPSVTHIGVSRRIDDEEERARLRDTIASLRENVGGGFIARTAAVGLDEPAIERDMTMLAATWNELRTREQNAPAPSLLHADLDLALRATRDLFVGDTSRLIVDDLETYERLRAFVERFMPSRLSRIELYREAEPLFERYGVELEIERALDRRVWLPSGGYLVIDEAEALTVIDVNTGRFVGRTHLEDTIARTNLEAVEETVRQLRLRNVGGIIVIDFIDMLEESNREKVMRALDDALKADRARTNVVRISDIGLVEMTRKRTRESLARSLTQPCHACNGSGRVRSRETICATILREAIRRAAILPPGPLTLSAHPEIATTLIEDKQATLDALEKRVARRVQVRADAQIARERFEIAVLDAASGE